MMMATRNQVARLPTLNRMLSLPIFMMRSLREVARVKKLHLGLAAPRRSKEVSIIGIGEDMNLGTS